MAWTVSTRLPKLTGVDAPWVAYFAVNVVRPGSRPSSSTTLEASSTPVRSVSNVGTCAELYSTRPRSALVENGASTFAPDISKLIIAPAEVRPNPRSASYSRVAESVTRTRPLAPTVIDTSGPGGVRSPNDDDVYVSVAATSADAVRRLDSADAASGVPGIVNRPRIPHVRPAVRMPTTAPGSSSAASLVLRIGRFVSSDEPTRTVFSAVA